MKLAVLLVVVLSLVATVCARELQKVFVKSHAAHHAKAMKRWANGKAHVIGFPGNRDLWFWNRHRKNGHIMVSENSVEDIVKNGKTGAWGFTPSCGVGNMFCLGLLFGGKAKGQVNDDNAMVKDVANRNGWLICEKEVDCDNNCQAKIAADHNGSPLAHMWYSFPKAGKQFACEGKWINLQAGHADANYDRTVDSCMNCNTWPATVGVPMPDMTGKVSVWYPAFVKSGAKCKCWVKNEAKDQADPACNIFQFYIQGAAPKDPPNVGLEQEVPENIGQAQSNKDDELTPDQVKKAHEKKFNDLGTGNDSEY